jgi:hypothetical protein
MTKLAFAIHQIIRGREAVEPGTVFPCATFDELEKMGAVRKPTADEASLYNLANKVVVEPETDESPQRADREARAKATGVTFKSNISDEKLMERVVEAEAKAAETETDVTQPPANLLD